jgi:hypothetical protein
LGEKLNKYINIEEHNIEDKIHCTVSKLDETYFEIFFSHL